MSTIVFMLKKKARQMMSKLLRATQNLNPCTRETLVQLESESIVVMMCSRGA